MLKINLKFLAMFFNSIYPQNHICRGLQAFLRGLFNRVTAMGNSEPFRGAFYDARYENQSWFLRTNKSDIFYPLSSWSAARKSLERG